MKSEVRKKSSRDSSMWRGFRSIWIEISRCACIDDFLSLFVQLEHSLNSHMYSPKNNLQLMSPHFRLKQRLSIQNREWRWTFSSYLMQRILYHAVVSNSPCDGFRCPDLSKEFVQTISHRLLVSAAPSIYPKPDALDDINCKISLAKCLILGRASKSDKSVNFLNRLKYFCNEKNFCLLQVYYRRRSIMRHSRRSNALGDPRKKVASGLGSNEQRVETPPQHWTRLIDFADRLSKTILQELHEPSSTSIKLTSSSHHPGRQLDNRHMNLSHHSTTTAIEETASCLERSIMLEVFSSIRRHRHLHNHLHQYHQQHAPITQASQSLARFADDLASQIVGEASQSAERRMSSVCKITDSILRLISCARPSELTFVPTNETQLNAAEPDREARLGTFAGSLTSQCLSEVLQIFNSAQAL